MTIVNIAGAVSMAIAACLYLWWDPLIALGYAGGVITGAGMLSALAFVLRKVIVPTAERPGARWPYLLLHVGKLGLAVAFAFLVVIVWRGSALAFTAGYTVALAAFIVVLRPHQTTLPSRSPDETAGDG